MIFLSTNLLDEIDINVNILDKKKKQQMKQSQTRFSILNQKISLTSQFLRLALVRLSMTFKNQVLQEIL